MEKYRNMIQQKIISNAIMLFLGGVVFIIGQSGFWSKYKPAGNFGDFISGFQVGLFMVLAVGIIASTSSICSALKDDKKLKAMYIKDTDERNMKISELTGKKLYQSISIPLLLASIVSGYFSAEVFFTLIAVIFFVSIVTIARKIYFCKTL